MELLRPRVRDDFPYPVAYPYSLIFDNSLSASDRRWALCFTQYQLLRVVGLTLVSQYLREPIDTTAKEAIGALNTAVASLRSPFFSDWLDLPYVFRRHLPRVGVQPLFPKLGEALNALNRAEERPVGQRGQTRLDPLRAILALRNFIAHGGQPDPRGEEAMRHIDAYLPVLHKVLQAFDFLGDCTLRVCIDREGLVRGRALIRNLRGASVAEPIEEELPDALLDVFTKSEAVLVGLDGRAVPLYPLLNPLPRLEPMYLYDGHYGIRLGQKEEVQTTYIYYLGVHDRTEESTAAGRLGKLLAARRISFFLEKEQVAPWTIADHALDYSRRTLLDLLEARKYIPKCYVPFAELERHFQLFLRVPDRPRWPAQTDRPRFINGLVLVGPGGAGKTAFLARQVEALLGWADGSRDRPDERRDNPNLVLFLRGDGLYPRGEAVSLFHDVAEKLGVAVGGKGLGSFVELLNHLHGRWQKDRAEVAGWCWCSTR